MTILQIQILAQRSLNHLGRQDALREKHKDIYNHPKTIRSLSLAACPWRIKSVSQSVRCPVALLGNHAPGPGEVRSATDQCTKDSNASDATIELQNVKIREKIVWCFRHHHLSKLEPEGKKSRLQTGQSFERKGKNYLNWKKYISPEGAVEMI